MKINIKDILESKGKDEYIDSEKRFDVKEAFAEALSEGDELKDKEDIGDKDEVSDKPVDEDKGEPDDESKVEPSDETDAVKEEEQAPEDRPDEEEEGSNLEPIEETPGDDIGAAEEKTGLGKLAGLFGRFRKKKQEPAEEDAEEQDADSDETAAVEEAAENKSEEGGSEADTETEALEEPVKAEAPEEPEETETLEEAPEETEEEPEKTEEEQESEESEKTEGSEEIEEPEGVSEEAADKTGEYKKYGWIAGIALSFVILLLVMIIYTNMIPRDVYATIDGERKVVSSTTHTVSDFLEDENIPLCDEDYISASLTAFIYDGMDLRIRHATDFKVTADGKTKEYKSLADTVGNALSDVEIELGSKDIVTPGLDTALADDMKIVVQRVKVKKATVEEKVPFKTKNKSDDSMNEGTSKVITEGVDGKDKVTYEITYIDGKESSRKEISRKSIKKAVDKVVAKGTRININGISYSRKLVVQATAYTATGNRTATGTVARVGVIAVDPNVIPLGSVVYIEGMGTYRAEDTGGAVRGNIIDIYMSSASECYRWGRRTVTVYVQ